jgi:mannose-6-phosphate isomerase-like protein (cupin superfamily)
MKPLIAILVLPLFAAEPAGLAVWSAKDLQAMEKKLSPKVDAQKFAGETLERYGRYHTMIAHRQGDGQAEVHDKVSDFFVVQSGEATLVAGGTLTNEKITQPGERRAPSINNGTRRKLAPGDIVHIPAGMPHQLLIEKGKQFTYFVVKIEK